jgi:hypothetical protein
MVMVLLLLVLVVMVMVVLLRRPKVQVWQHCRKGNLRGEATTITSTCCRRVLPALLPSKSRRGRAKMRGRL